MSQSPVDRSTLVRLVPMLAVRDLQRTIEWYRTKLEFECRGTFGDPPVWCHLQRDGVQLFFNQPPASCFPPEWPGHVQPSGQPYLRPREGHPTEQIRSLHIFYMHVDRLPALHASLSERGTAPTPMRVTGYGMQEFELRDPDGYWLWFGEDTDEPPTESE
jgi:catechol 2,3-dioxygenase-like lactoylglutathione lyase family enzyme